MNWVTLFQMWNNALEQLESESQRRAASNLFYSLLKMHLTTIKSNERNHDFLFKDTLRSLMCYPYLLSNLPIKTKSCILSNTKRSFLRREYPERSYSPTPNGFNREEAIKEKLDYVIRFFRLYPGPAAALFTNKKEDTTPGNVNSLPYLSWAIADTI